MPKVSNSFTIANFEVRFLQSAPITVCVIRSLTDRSQKYTGISVCHPSDTWNEAVGRHKAMKNVLENSKRNVTGTGIFDAKGSAWVVTVSVEGEPNFLPFKEIQRAYWEHYKESE